jgi:hypothetical protein
MIEANRIASCNAAARIVPRGISPALAFCAPCIGYEARRSLIEVSGGLFFYGAKLLAISIDS